MNRRENVHASFTRRHAAAAALALAAALAAPRAARSETTVAPGGGTMVTISASGSTALRSFIIGSVGSIPDPNNPGQTLPNQVTNENEGMTLLLPPAFGGAPVAGVNTVRLNAGPGGGPFDYPRFRTDGTNGPAAGGAAFSPLDFWTGKQADGSAGPAGVKLQLAPRVLAGEVTTGTQQSSNALRFDIRPL